MASLDAKTNEALRKKYFVDAGTVLTGERSVRRKTDRQKSNVIPASAVAISDQNVLLRHGAVNPQDQITVDMVRDGGRIKKLIITCPCGRHAELACEYAPGG